MRKIFGSALMVCLLVFSMITLGCSNGSTGGGGGGGLDTRLFGTWVNDADAGISFTVEEDNAMFYEFHFDITNSSGHSQFTFAVRQNGDVFSGVGGDLSFKAVFEGGKLRVSEATGYVEGFDGLYTKQP